ncbi:MAG: electron transport complex subunit E [Clostridia bacterium]|nr:electron transport complex subunit E [Eubacteriales bacterium]MDD3866510.1 electron transport complex subunit E [Eubacteriales bacterium]MDD4460711.1 electron transport complex subunit E [Eubacteriales bacterium]NCC47571.1 electron transport complex subunit E [Clostridia bacterium]
MAKKKQQPLLTIFGKGLLRENPVLRLVLGMCPTLAVTTSVENGLGMGLAASFVLISSNLIISLLRNAIPAKVRIPAFITIIAGMVTLVQMLMQAFLPALNESLGIFIPLITVNCIILARAEMFASKNAVLPSVIDGLGMGLGYTAALVLMGTIREIMGNGSFFNLSLPGLQAGGYIEPMLVMILPPGGFFALGILVAFAQKLNAYLDKRERQPADQDLNCAGAINDQTACLLCGGCSLGQRGEQGPVDPETAEFNKRGNRS